MGDSDDLKLQGSIRMVLKRFLADLQSHLTKSEYRNFLFGRTRLDDVNLDYKPESYTRHNLVNPLLRAVGLHFQPEPRTPNVSRKRWPDFEVTNTAIAYIGEVKPANCLEDGTDEIKVYLGMGGFQTPYGFLTDGIQWEIFGPPERSKKVGAQRLKTVSLSDALKIIAKAENFCEIDALSGKVSSNGLAEIEQFESTFTRDRLDGWALERLSRKDRETFSTDGRMLQASLEGNWD